MDPNAALALVRTLIGQMRDLDDHGNQSHEKAMELVDMIANLDCWLTDGGSYPADWAVKFR